MATLTIEYNPRSNFANALISLIKYSNSVKIIEKSEKEMLLQNLSATGKEAKQIAAGKKRGKTLDELLK